MTRSDDSTAVDLHGRLDAIGAAQRDLRRGYRRARWLLLTGLLIAPAAWIWGLPGVMIATVIVVALVGATYYVIWNHTQEYRAEAEMIHARIETAEGAAREPPPPPPTRWNASRRRRAGWL